MLSIVAFASHGSAVPGTVYAAALVETVTAAKPQIAARVASKVLGFIGTAFSCLPDFRPQLSAKEL
jgi:hypothetical protein